MPKWTEGVANKTRTPMYASQNHRIGSVKRRTNGLERLTLRISVTTMYQLVMLPGCRVINTGKTLIIS